MSQRTPAGAAQATQAAAYQQQYQAYQQAQAAAQAQTQAPQAQAAAGGQQQAQTAQQQQQMQAYQAQLAQQRAQQAQQGGQTQQAQQAPTQQQQAMMQQRQAMMQQQAAAAQQRAAFNQAGAAQAQAQAARGSSSYVVYTTGNDGDEVVVRTLVGEYVEKAANHGRKVYQKVADKSAGPDFVDVFLYYWDNRDGPSFEGWWFGNKLGGTQVWSHCKSNDLTPPTTGWKIPWDGAVRSTLVITGKAEPTQGSAKDAEEKLRMLAAEVAKYEGPAKQALEQAKAAVGDYSTPGPLLQQVEQMLTPLAGPLGEVLRKLSEGHRVAAGETQRNYAMLANQVRATHAGITQELMKLRSVRNRAETDAKQKEAEERDGKLFQEMLPEATEKANRAEDFVEKAMITSEMIAAGGDNLEEVQRSVAETENAARQAQASIGEARIFVNAKQASVKRFESDKVRAMATSELAKLQQQLQEAQNKLAPLKTARQDFMQRQVTKRIVEEILQTLNPAEVECDKAEEAMAILTSTDLTKEALQESEQAVKKANDTVTMAVRMIEQRKSQATGAAATEIGKLHARAKVAEGRVQTLKSTHKEGAERVTCELLLKEAGEKLQSVQESVAKAGDAEGPFLMGVEELPLDETLTAVQACEAAATSANTAVSICRMFLATKVVEAKRFSERPSQETTAKLKELQKQLEAYTDKLTRLRKVTTERKVKALMREAEEQVSAAEELANKVGEAAALFEDDTRLCDADAADIRKAAEETEKAEVAANSALAAARKYITARQIEAKGREASVEMGTELIKYQTRLGSSQAEVTKWKRLVATCEQRIAAKKTVEEAKVKLAATEETVKKVGSMVTALLKEGGDSDEAVKAADVAATECQASIKEFRQHMDTQGQKYSAAKEELTKMLPALRALEEKLEESKSAMRERAEKLQVKVILADSERKVKDAEESVTKAGEASFLKVTEELPLEQASAGLAELEAAVQNAHTVVGGTKTFIAMKRLAVKRLSETVTASSQEDLSKLMTRLDGSTKKLADIRKGMQAKKHATVKREITAKIADVEELVEAAKQATLSLSGEDAKDPEKMKVACEKAGSTQGTASAAIDATKKMVLQRQKDAKAHSTDPATFAELVKLMEQVGGLQSQLDKLKATLRDQEHKFVAGKLLQDAKEKVEALEKQSAAVNDLASPLQSENLMATYHLGQIVDALKRHAQEMPITNTELFAELAGSEGGKLDKAKFVDFVTKMPELCEQEDSIFMPEELNAAYRRFNGTEGEVTLEQFLQQFRKKYVCMASVAMTDDAAVKGGKTLRKLAVGEVIEELQAPTKDPSLGLQRVKAKAEKDEKEGFVTIAGNQGTVYLEAHSPFAASEKQVEQGIQELVQAINQCMRYLDQKIEELRGVKNGPLADAKAEMSKMKPRVTKVQAGHHELKRHLVEAQRQHKDRLEGEKHRRQDAVDRRAARALIIAATEVADKALAEADKVVPAAEAMVKSRAADLEDPFTTITKAESDIEAALVEIGKAHMEVKKHLDNCKNTQKGPYAEAKSTLIKLKVKLGACEAKGQRQLHQLKSTRKQVESDAHDAIVSTLRTHAKSVSLDPEALYKQLGKGELDIPFAAMKDFLEKIPKSDLKASQLQVGLSRYVNGVSKICLKGMLQEYMRCIKEISITTLFEVKESKSLRKLSVGEIVEVLETPKLEVTGLLRTKCRSLLDQTEGYVTMKGNKDTTYMERCDKPYFCCESELEATEAMPATSPEAHRMRVGEVLEVMEGPRREEPSEVVRLRGICKSDRATGWVTQKDAAGRINLEQKKLLVCLQSVAITSGFDIGEAKSLRKLDVGETLEVVEGAQEDDSRSLSRLKVRSMRDRLEGWVTLKGNQGTAYVQESDKFYVCKKTVAIEAKLTSDSRTVRILKEGEIFEALEPSRIESKEGAQRIRGRSISSGSEGWVTLVKDKLVAWSPRYKCDASTTLTDALELTGAKAIRKLEQGESLEALDAPTEDKASGALRLRLRAEKDNATGFATVRGNHGLPFLYTVAAPA